MGRRGQCMASEVVAKPSTKRHRRPKDQPATDLGPHASGTPAKRETPLASAGHRVRINVASEGSTAGTSARLVEMGLRFGIPLSVPSRTIAHDLALELKPGTVTLITGPSGSGKSLLLNAIAAELPVSRMMANVPFPLDVSVLDAVAPTRPVYEALGLLTACGLGEPMLWIRRFNQLSDGEQFRARMARAISLSRRQSGLSPLLCDEFGAILHRRLARSIAFNLGKLARRENLCLVVATSQDDLESDLQADQVVRLGGEAPLVKRESSSAIRASRPRISFTRRLRIEPGTLRDYELFSAMHYRRRDTMGFIDKVFVMREGSAATPLGIVIYGHPALEIGLRNQVTGKRFVRNSKRLNRELRVLKRLVIHPDVRGCGLGHWLVRKTLPEVGTRFVECLAAMAVINPVFDKAGMRRVGTIAPPLARKRTMMQLREAGADPLAADFVAQVCRRPSIRRLVKESVAHWYRTTTAGGERRVEHQSPRTLAQTFRQLAGSQPVYFIWSADNAGWSLIDKHADATDGTPS